MSVDWEELSAAIGTRFKVGTALAETGGDNHARSALELIVGRPAWEDAVEHCLAFRPGYELARSVLSLVQPRSAMDYVHAIFKSDRTPGHRRAAIELLRSFADRTILDRVPDYLNDEDPDIRHWGLRVLDRILWCGADLSDPGVISAFDAANAHPDRDFGATAASLRKEWEVRTADWAKADAAANAVLSSMNDQN